MTQPAGLALWLNLISVERDLRGSERRESAHRQPRLCTRGAGNLTWSLTGYCFLPAREYPERGQTVVQASIVHRAPPGTKCE